MHPLDVPTAQTVNFVHAHAKRGAHILEVGCGDGQVAYALSQKGFQITAIDSDAERVAKAQAPGVRAVVANWPNFEIDPVDAIVFTRSLHHMEHLAEAIQHASSVLKPGGVFLVDDFAMESVDERTLNWFKELVRSEVFAALVDPHPDSFVARLIAAPDAMEAFENHHSEHGVHSFDLMDRLVAESFPGRSIECVPYFYRYFASAVSESNESEDGVGEFFRRELDAAGRNRITLIGRRVVARAGQ